MRTFGKMKIVLWMASVVLAGALMAQDQSPAAQPQGPPATSQAKPANSSPQEQQSAPEAQSQPGAQEQPQTPTTAASPDQGSSQKKTEEEKSQQKPSAKSTTRARRSAHRTKVSKTAPNATPNNAATRATPAAEHPPAQPGKVVVRNGGAKDGPVQLAPAMTQEQQLHDRENTAQLLSTTDAKLKSVAGRQLTPSQQSMLDQIHTYMRQAKEASDSGDLARAHTLAYKAHLLSDELLK
jgi:hypothetical protein